MSATHAMSGAAISNPAAEAIRSKLRLSTGRIIARPGKARVEREERARHLLGGEVAQRAATAGFAEATTQLGLAREALHAAAQRRDVRGGMQQSRLAVGHRVDDAVDARSDHR